MATANAKKLRSELQAARLALRRERSESRRRAALVDITIRSNDLREVCTELYRYFYRYFGVYKGDITILTDYDEREIYDLVGFSPRERHSGPKDLHETARTHCERLKALVEEQIFIGYLPEERREIQRSHMIEQSLLECMVSKRSRVVNNVRSELSPKEVEEARKQRTLSWVNWVVLHPENSKLLAKLHMSFRTPKRLTQEGLSRRLKPFEDLLRYRILHTRDFKRVKYLSERDSLTGFYLRPVLARRLEQFLESGGRGELRLSASMMDLDFFKRFNDRYGHDVGDSVLRRFSQAVQATLRGSDVVGRYGGEEFAAFFPGASSEDALSILRRIFDRVKDLDFLPPSARDAGAAPERLSFSAGVATFLIKPPRPGAASHPARRPNFEEVMKAADDLLLRAKRAGRRRCVFRDLSGAVREYHFEAAG